MDILVPQLAHSSLTFILLHSTKHLFVLFSHVSLSCYPLVFNVITSFACFVKILLQGVIN